MDDFEKTQENTENAKAERQDVEAGLLDEEPEFIYSYLGNGYECMLLGVTTVIGGQLYGWNAGFSSGFGSYFLGQILVGLAYIVLLSCLAESSATLAFPGGTYGLARAVLGFFPGFLVGCFESAEYLFMSTASVVYIGQLFVSFTNCDPNFQPALWFIFYGFTILTTCFDARIFWATSSALAIVCLVLMMIYSLGSLQYVNLALNGPYFNNTATYVNTSTLSHFNLTDNSLTTRIMHSSGQNYTQVLMTPLIPGSTTDPSFWFVGGFTAWLSGLQFCTWGFAGIESLTLMTSMTKDPKQAISFGCSYGVIVLFFTCILTVVVCAAMPPGLFVTSGLDTFMSVGYMMMFPNLSYVSTLAMILPGQIGMAWGFIVPTGKLLSSLATSNLLPSFFMLRGAKSPRKGILVGCTIGYLICLIGFYVPAFSAALQPIAIASSNLCYFSNLWAFYKLRTTFGMLPREYKSPYGLIGAGFCLCVFVLVFISTVFFQGDPTYTCLISMIGIMGVLCLYYYCFAKHTQTFSKDEQKTVFRLHVIVFNMRKMRNATRPGYTR